MMNSEKFMTIAEAFGSLKIEDPLFARNLSIFPMTNGEDLLKKNLITLEEGMGAGSVAVNELDTPIIEKIRIDNMDEDDLFLLDGEEIFGARQTRITTTAALVPAKTNIQMPVACIEEGRWDGDSGFEGSFTSAHPRLRSIICKGVNDSLSKGLNYKAPQREVWNEVTRKLTSLEVSSGTSSFHDISSALKEETGRYLIEPEAMDGARGMIVTSGLKLLGIEYSATTSLFKRLLPKLLRGYSLDALEQRSSSKPPDKKNLGKILNRIQGLRGKAFAGVSSGKELRFSDSELLGRALVIDDCILQASFFPALN